MLYPLESNFDFHYKIKLFWTLKKRTTKKMLRKRKSFCLRSSIGRWGMRLKTTRTGGQKRRGKKRKIWGVGLRRIIVYIIEIATKYVNNWNNTDFIQMNRSFEKQKNTDFAKQKRWKEASFLLFSRIFFCFLDDFQFMPSLFRISIEYRKNRKKNFSKIWISNSERDDKRSWKRKAAESTLNIFFYEILIFWNSSIAFC